VLVKHGADDLYGRWVVCEIKIMPLADVNKIIGHFGITPSTVMPFGLMDAYFYDQIRYTTGVHVFTYTFLDDVRDYFGNLVLDACRG
jgi:hypothetical protein